MSTPKKQIFISYAHQDSNFVDKLVSSLEKYSKMEITYDKKILTPGDSLFDIFTAIEQCDFFLVVISKNSIQSKWVKQELSTAFIRRIQVGNITIIPLITDDAKIPPAISDTIYVDFRENFNEGLKELIETFQLMTPPRSAHPSIELISPPTYTATDEQIANRLKFYHHILKRYDRFLIDLSRFEDLTAIDLAEYFKKRIIFFEAAKKIFNLEIEALQEKTSPDLSVPLEFANRKEEIIQIRAMIESILELLGPSGFGKSYILKAIKEDKFQLARGVTPNFVWHYAYIDFSLPDNRKLLLDFSGRSIISRLIEELKSELAPQQTRVSNIIDIIGKLYAQDHRGRDNANQITSVFLFMLDRLDGIQDDMIRWLIGLDGPIGDSITDKFCKLTPRPIFKMVLSSRRPVIKSRSWCKQKILRHSVTALNINVVQDLLCDALRNEGTQMTPDALATWAQNIWDLTSGHPRCVNRLCIKIAKDLFCLPGLQQLFEENVIGVILQETLNSYHESIQYLLWCLSPFRRINEDILLVLAHHKYLLLDGGLRFQFSDQSQLMEQLLKTALFIEDAMKFTYKFEYSVRQILHLWMKYESQKISQQLNDIACKMYEERILDLNGLGEQQEAISTISTIYRRVYVQEAIYHYILQLEYNEENKKNWSEFLETKIDFYLENLYSRAHELEVMRRLKELIWDEWEKDEELHEEINRITNDNEARNQLDQIMKKLINTHDEKWKQFYIKK
jgi:hypothetical protein